MEPRSRWRRLGAVALGTLVGLALGEVVLRASGHVPLENSTLRGFHRGDDALGWAGTPDLEARFRGPEFDLVIHHDADGFRAPGVAFDGPADAPTVAFFGDSFTWGWAVDEGGILPDLVQRELGATRRVLNRGVNAWGTAQQRLLLERVLEEERPDRVVVMFFANDPGECSTDRGGKRPFYSLDRGRLVLENSPVRTALNSPLRELTKRSLVLTDLRWAVNRAAEIARNEEVAALEHHVASGTPPGWRVCAALLREMGALCDAAGAELQVVYIPLASELPRAPEEEPYALRRLVAELCAEAGIPHLDLTPGLREAWLASPDAEPNGWPQYYRIDGHWTAAGHRVAAQLLLRWWTEG